MFAIGVPKETTGFVSRYTKPLELLFVDCFFQFDARGELRYLAGSDLDRRAGLRVPAIARAPLRDREGSKPNQRNAFTFFQSRGDAVDQCVDRRSRLGLADVGCTRDFIDP